MHYRGWLRVIGRDKGYGDMPSAPTPPVARPSRQERIDALIDIVVNKYAPLPTPSLSYVIGRLR